MTKSCKLALSYLVILSEIGTASVATDSDLKTFFGASNYKIADHTLAQLNSSDPEDIGSFGQPDSLAAQLLQESDALVNLITIEDTVPEGENIDNWTDEQVEAFYYDDLEFTNDWLDRVQQNSASLVDVGTSMEATIPRTKARKKSRRSGMSAMSCMAAAIQGEAGAESAAGKKLVGAAIMRRAGGSAARVCQVVFANSQFESMDGRRRRAPSAASIRAAKSALALGGKCTYDHFINKKLQRDLGRKIPQWVRNFERWGCRSTKIGGHHAYASCDCKRRR